MHKAVLLSLVIRLVLFARCEASGWWMDQPYNDSTTFNIRAEYTENATLKCEDEILDGTRYEIQYWVRPDLTVMNAGDEKYFETLDGTAGWKVDADKVMHIITVQEEHFGFYHCIVYSAPHYRVIKKGLNYKGPHFGDLWDVYRMNVIIGCSAAGGFFVACILIYVVNCIFFNNDSDTSKTASDTGSVNVFVTDDERGYDDLKKDIPLNSENTNEAYAVHDEDDDTKL